jgi:lysine-N-methylase
MKTFQCIGPDCEDPCCHGFTVDIDKQTYLKYIHTKDKELKAKFNTVLKLNKQSSNDLEYGFLQFSETNKCPMLTEKGWCSIQQKLGEEALSLTCHSYPRVTNNILNQVEKGATTSCPEIARLALLNENGISFEQLEEDDSVRNAIGFTMDEKSPLTPYFWDLRIFTIELLQNRIYPLTDRLLILGLFCQKASELVDLKQFDSLSTLITQYKQYYSETTQFQNLSMKINSNPVWQLNVFRKLYKASENIKITASSYEALRSATLAGFQLDADDDVNFTNEEHAREVKHYKDVIETWHSLIEGKYGYIFENYLVNAVFINVFPRTGYKTLIEEFMMLAAKFSMIRFMVYGVAEQLKETFNEHDVVSCIQAFSKQLEHNQNFIGYIYKQFMMNKCDNVARMAVLLKTV